MPSVNRPQIRVPRRLWDEMMLALDQTRADRGARSRSATRHPPGL